ncbi:kinase-regulated stress-responsive transcription factor skn7 [Coemansia sp. RSA 988]|nr:kinase-regulated stress-responsive transcription factor skn7 [Coemansia sp. RSA 988]
MNNEINQSLEGVLQPSIDDKFDIFALSTGVPDFVKKLFRMLEDETHQDIVCWGYGGESFVVKDPNEFSKYVLPQHFKHNNFASFVRQLNKYDFHKVKVTEDKRYGDEAWEFKHPKFQQNRPDLLERIKRKIPPKSKSLGGVGNGRHGDGELRIVADDLQSQIHLLTHAHAEVSMYMHQLGKQQQVISDEINGLKKTMQTQDQLMEEFVRYLVNQEAAGTGNGKCTELGSSTSIAMAAAAAAATGLGNIGALGHIPVIGAMGDTNAIEVAVRADGNGLTEDCISNCKSSSTGSNNMSQDAQQQQQQQEQQQQEQQQNHMQIQDHGQLQTHQQPQAQLCELPR